MAACDSFFPYEEVAYQCELSPHRDDVSDHLALTKTPAMGLRAPEQWGLVVWTTAMAQKRFP